MSVSCFTMSERLHQYVDGELPEGERAEVEGHLAACAHCREARGRLDALRALLRRELADPEPRVALAGLWPALERRLDAPPAGPGAATIPFLPGERRAAVARWRRPRPLAALAAAAVLLVVALPIAARWLFAPVGTAEVAAVEGGESASVILLAGNESQSPIIWVTESPGRPAALPSRAGDPL